MSKINFYLRDVRSTKETTIVCILKHGNDKQKIYINKKIHPALWDGEIQIPTSKKDKIEPFKKVNPHIKVQLENLTRFIYKAKDIHAEYIAKHEIANEKVQLVKLKDYMIENLNIAVKKPKPQTHNKSSSDLKLIKNYYYNFLNDMESGNVLTPKKRRYKNATIVSYISTFKKYRDFEKSKNAEFNFDQIDLNWYNEFVVYFQSQKYAQNTIGNGIKHLKVIMESALKDGIHDNMVFRNRNFKTIEADSYQIYLSEKELERIKNLNFEIGSDMEKVRDIFLLAYYTCQRISDVRSIKKSMIKKDDSGREYLDFNIKKSSEKNIIPIYPEAKIILEKYNSTVPAIDLTTINILLKRIGKLAGIDEIETFNIHKGGEEVVIKKPKYEMISTHTARRSTVTNLSVKGEEKHKIMLLSGHKSEKSFAKYNKAPKLEMAKVLWDFKL
jgi:integrase